MHPSVPIPVWLRLGLRAQLALALGVIGTLLVAVIVSTLLSMAHIHDLASKTVEVEGRLNRLASNVVTYTLLCHRYEKEAFLSLGDRNVRNYYLLLWDGAYFNLNTSIQAFADAAATEADRQRAETWLAQGAKYHESFTQLKQAMTRGEITRPEDANAALGPHRGEIQGLTNTALQTAQIKATRAQRAEEELVASTARSTQSTLLIGGIALVVAVAWIVLFPARLMRPIKVLQAAIAQLASGDLTARVRLARNDELGVLASGFDQMARTIQQRTDDIVAQRAQAEAARMEAETARAEIAGQLATIEEQRSVIREMSVPILPLSASTLVMPLVGALDSQRIQLIQEQALQTIEHSSARYLILDITGVPIVDSQVAQGLIQIVQAARLLGTEVVLVGIRPEVAQAVVGLGIHLDTTITRGTLQSGMAYVVQHSQ